MTAMRDHNGGKLFGTRRRSRNPQTTLSLDSQPRAIHRETRQSRNSMHSLCDKNIVWQKQRQRERYMATIDYSVNNKTF